MWLPILLEIHKTIQLGAFSLSWDCDLDLHINHILIISFQRRSLEELFFNILKQEFYGKYWSYVLILLYLFISKNNNNTSHLPSFSSYEQTPKLVKLEESMSIPWSSIRDIIHKLRENEAEHDVTIYHVLKMKGFTYIELRKVEITQEEESRLTNML
jgi:hypothetical protein